jgi:hypothetical protein
MTARGPKGPCHVEEEQGWTQLRFYPTCPRCGWFPLHSKTLTAALEVAAGHNRARHPEAGPPEVKKSPGVKVR